MEELEESVWSVDVAETNELEYRGKCVEDTGKISATGQRMRHIM